MDKENPSRCRPTAGNNVQGWALKQPFRAPKIVGEPPTPRLRRPKRRSLSVGATISIAAICLLCCSITKGKELSPAEARQIGKRIWQNECNGTVSGLTSWNSGENFASLGIGHFIWYPKGEKGPFEESFPRLVAFMSSRGTRLPPLMRNAASGPCPWNNRSEFLKAQNSEPMRQLREFLAHTIDLQSQFLIERLSQSLPKMLAESAPAQRPQVQANFERLLNTPQGCYGLVDYVNFKGEGVLNSERYAGQGWGLLQVLEEMRPGVNPAEKEFSRAAAQVLKRRVKNAPPARNEQRWLAGWLKRVNSYNRD
jgi:hypothetical protein